LSTTLTIMRRDVQQSALLEGRRDEDHMVGRMAVALAFLLRRAVEVGAVW
jgi:hypothetical protein